MDKLPFVWELDYEGIRSYAIGTKHNEPDLYATDIAQRLSGIEYLLLEIDPRDPAQKIEMPKNVSESLNALTPEERLRLVPLITALIGTKPKKDQALSGVDGAFYETAVGSETTICGLETPQEHSESFNEMFSKITPENLKQMANDKTALGLTLGYMRSMDKSYRKGDADELAFLLALSGKKESIAAQLRNKNMTDRSLTLLSYKPSIVAVGVAHYLCEPSMLTMYQEKGIKIKRI